LGVLLVAAGGLFAYKHFWGASPAAKAASGLQFDNSVSEAEEHSIRQAVEKQHKTFGGAARVSVATKVEVDNVSSVLAAYVPVTNIYTTRQVLTKADLVNLVAYVPAGTDGKVRTAIEQALSLSPGKLAVLSTPAAEVPDTAVAFIPADQLTPKVKLLTFEGAYYLDSFTKGAVFRQATIGGAAQAALMDLKLNNYASKDTTLKVNMTGVTALTRLMMRKLSSVKDASYFSQQIGGFLSDADITHVSNEVSFKTGCTYSDTQFCAPPGMIDALKSSGVDLVELTGNHNNDTGNTYNTESINLYHSLGWHTFGGGLNTVEGAKPYLAGQKGSKLAFLGYNYADGLGSGAIASDTTAGANHFDFDKIKSDIAAVKQQADFIIVDVQFWECYAYPNGYVEFPECDQPIPNQREVFRQLIDMGADMVVGTQAHQPQTYELYNGKPIYYGLGNLYFEQTQWPGTERGIILTHYFVGGKLVQTKLSPTVYGQELQTHLMADGDALKLLERLKTARQAAGL